MKIQSLSKGGDMAGWYQKTTKLLLVAASFGQIGLLFADDKIFSLDLKTLIEGYRKNNSASNLFDAISAKATANKEGDLRRFVGPYNLEIKSEIDAKDPSSAAKVEAGIKRKIAFGNTENTASRKHEAEAEADKLTKLFEIKESELQIASLFIRLRQKKAAAVETKKFAEALSPLLKQTKTAARMGNLSGLLVTKWELYFDSLTTELDQISSSYKILAETLSTQTGMAIDSDPSKSNLRAIVTSNELLNIEMSPVVKSGILREESLTLKASQAKSRWEIDAGIGVSRNLIKNINSIFLEIGIPLGTSSAAASEISSIEAEKLIVRAETNIKQKQIKDNYQTALMHIQDSKKIIEITQKRILGLENLLNKADLAFRSGQGDVVEVLEISKEIYETKLKSGDVLAGLEQQFLEAKYLVTGDVL